MDTIQKNSKVIALVAGVAAVGAGLYLLFRKASKDSLEDRVDIVDETGAEVPRADLERILLGIKPQYEGEYLTIATISQICDATLTVATHKFIELTHKDRKERRANKDNLQKIVDLWEEYAHSLEEIIEESQKEILKPLGISDTVWENSNTFHMSRGSPELMMLHASLPQKLKMSLQSTRTLSRDEFRKILRAQVDLLDQEADNADNIRDLLKRPEEIAPIVQNRVSDAIFEQYGVEEEDIYMAMKQHMTDPQVQQIFMDLQRATMKLMPMQGAGGYM